MLRPYWIIDDVLSNPLVGLFIADDTFPIIALPNRLPGRATQFVYFPGSNGFEILHHGPDGTGLCSVGL